jgi:hypothetical protein
MRHKMHTFYTGGYFHCSNCKCGKVQKLGPNDAICAIAAEARYFPEENLMLLSQLGVPIAWFWEEDSGKIVR